MSGSMSIVTRAISHHWQSTIGADYGEKKCTYIDLLRKIPSQSHDVLAFRSTNLRSGNLSESMTQGDKEVMVGRWRGMPQR